MKKLSSTLPNMLLSLGGICVLVSGILAVVNKVTTAPIAEAEMRAKVEAIRAVAPAFDNNPFAEKLMVLPEGETDSLTVYPAKKGGSLVGFAIESYTQKGFSGLIHFVLLCVGGTQIVLRVRIKISDILGNTLVSFDSFINVVLLRVGHT